MRKGLLLLYEKEIDYATHFTDYFNELPDFIFEIRTFTNLQVMNDYLDNHEADMLLVSEDISLEEWQEKKAKKVIRLIEELETGTEQQTIYKYQSMEQIKTELIKIWGEREVKTIKTSDCIAVCSPFGGSGKTLFSLAYGQAVTKKERYYILEWNQ